MKALSHPDGIAVIAAGGVHGGLMLIELGVVKGV